MITVDTILYVLEKHRVDVAYHLGDQWVEFVRRAQALDSQFSAVQDDSEEGMRALIAAVRSLLEICRGYPYTTELFTQIDQAFRDPGVEIGVPKAPKGAPPPGPKEIAKRYQSLLEKL